MHSPLVNLHPDADVEKVARGFKFATDVTIFKPKTGDHGVWIRLYQDFDDDKLLQHPLFSGSLQ